MRQIRIKSGKLIIYLLFAVVLWTSQGSRACASEVDELLDDLDFAEIDQTLDSLLGNKSMNFESTVSELAGGESVLDVGILLTAVKNQLLEGFQENGSTIIHVMIIAVIAAIFTNFSNVFNNSQISEVSFYIIYLLLLAILTNSFYVTSNIATQTISGVVDFMKVLVPAYMLSITFASGAITASAFYQIVIGVIYLVSIVILKIVIPMIHIYVVLVLVNNLSKEDFLSKLADLVRTGIDWILKTMLAIVIGFNVVQGLIAPVVDNFKVTVLSKTASAIPGIGNTADSIAGIVLGSAVLIKNAVGVAALIAIIVMCLVPLIKLGLFAFMYRMAGAVIQPVSDKRMINSIGIIGEGMGLLLRTLFHSMLLFLVTVALITASTMRGV